jgi:type II secretory pathway pseudopilin PulG
MPKRSERTPALRGTDRSWCRHQRAGAKGFTYLAVLFAIALLSIALAVTAEFWSTTSQRQREAQYLWVGEQYRQAIASYYYSSPGLVKSLPLQLSDLLEDTRYPFVRRHLRQLYSNPLSGQFDWEVLRAPDGGIFGLKPNQPPTFKDVTQFEFRPTPAR